MLSSTVAAVLLLALPQDPTAGGTDAIETLARRVQTAHRPAGPVAPVTEFRSNLELYLLDAGATAGGQVDLGVQFLLWQQPGRKLPTPLIRYELKETGTPIVRGRDKFGPWQMSRGEARDLTGADFATDLEAFDRHANLARQLLRFLSPGEMLRALQQPTPVLEEALALERGVRVPCATVAGDLPAFPLLQRGGDDVPVHLKVYVSQAEGHLVAVEAWPLVQGTKDESRCERVLLLDLHERDGVLVPHELKHLFREPSGQLRLKSRAVLTTLSLRPELRAEDFDRPKK